MCSTWPTPSTWPLTRCPPRRSVGTHRAFQVQRVPDRQFAERGQREGFVGGVGLETCRVERDHGQAHAVDGDAFAQMHPANGRVPTSMRQARVAAALFGRGQAADAFDDSGEHQRVLAPHDFHFPIDPRPTPPSLLHDQRPAHGPCRLGSPHAEASARHAFRRDRARWRHGSACWPNSCPNSRAAAAASIRGRSKGGASSRETASRNPHSRHRSGPVRTASIADPDLSAASAAARVSSEYLDVLVGPGRQHATGPTRARIRRRTARGRTSAGPGRRRPIDAGIGQDAASPGSTAKAMLPGPCACATCAALGSVANT